ncbi:HU family DNA-binding protein [Candidatus Merdisoma sp. JLR.KK006]|uniref:HU family DNA-binding protein n=1 Tax=Candidatus Merdisoma sp. JLR.KK006 TaxID=3112626 RepID=UPI002FEEF9A7
MDNELHKKDIINKISEKLIDEKIVIGGNKSFYKRKYHLKYTQKIIGNVLDAFWDVIAEVIEDGDSIKLYNYIKIEPRYYKAVKLNAKGFPGIKENVVAARYRMKFIMGERLKEACRRLSQKKCSDDTSENTEASECEGE